MKKTISLLLSILMLVSAFSFTCAQAFALEAETIFTVVNSGFNNDEITYVVSLAPNQTNIKSVILNFEFDSSALIVDESKSGEIGESTANSFVANLNGMYESGFSSQNNGKYVVAFFNPNGESTDNSVKAFVKVTFKAISDDRRITGVKISCSEYITDDSDDTNDITKASPIIIDESEFLPLNAVKNKEVLSTENGLKFVWEKVVGATSYNIYRRPVGEGEWVLIDNVSAPQTEYVNVIDGEDLNVEFEYVAEPCNEDGFVPHSQTGVKGKYFGTIKEIYTEMTETGANVYWSALEGEGEFSYSLYQKAEDEASWTYVNTVSSTVCHSKELESGVKYYFTVKAHSGDYLAETSAPDGEIIFLGAPDDVVASIFDDNITLTWSDVKGADSYIVYKMLAGTIEDVSSSTVAGDGSGSVSFADEDVVNGELYTYQIQSVKSSGEKSVRGIKGTNVRKLPVTKNVVTELGKSYISIKWDAAEGADSYKVLSKEASATAWSILGSSKTTEYRDTRVASGKYYVYAVATLSDDGKFEAENSIPSEPILYIATPTINSVASYGDRINVMWKTIQGVDSYDVYKFYPDADEWSYYANTSTNTYDDYDVVGGSTYGYTVVARIGDNTSLFDSEGVWAKFLSATTSFTAENASNGISLNWSPVLGADGYVIEHRTSNTVFSELVRLDANTTSYTHTGAVSGQDNIYCIYAYSGNTISATKEASCRFLSAPVLKSVAISDRNKVLIQWGSASGATSYNIYRKACYETEWTLIGTTSATKFVDSDVFYTNDYTYTVQACHNNALSSFDPIGLSIKPTVNGTPYLDQVNSVWRCKVGTAYNYYYKGLVSYYGALYYVSESKLDWSYTGYVAYNNEYYYVQDGVAYTGLMEQNGVWCYVENGRVNYNITTLVNFAGAWYYVENGVVNFNATTLVNYYGAWYYVENGVLNFNATTLVHFCGAWYYVENGVVNFNATTLVLFYGDWYYVENGVVNFNATTLVNFCGTWYYIENGVLNFNATTLVNFCGTWYYVENGVLNFNATTLVYFYGDWYYVENGVLNFNATTLVYFYGDWYYVENGVVNFNATTLVYFYGSWYYVENGVVNFNATTLVSFCGSWYYVENGVVNFNATTLVNFCGTWYYIENGVLNWNSDTLVPFCGDWYYVKNGTIAWDYTGYVYFYGGYYYVVNGWLD